MSTDNILNWMRNYRNDGEDALDRGVFLDLNQQFAECFHSDNELLQSQLHVLAHMVNAYMPIVYLYIESEGHTNWIKKFYDEKMSQSC